MHKLWSDPILTCHKEMDEWMADLCKIGLWRREWCFRNFSSKAGAMAMKGPLPAELKLRENTEYTTNRFFFIGERKGRQMRRKRNKNKQDGWGTKRFILYLLVFALA